jgi:hypothetical protein
MGMGKAELVSRWLAQTMRMLRKRGLPAHVTCSLFVPLCGLDQTKLVDLMLLAAHFLRKSILYSDFLGKYTRALAFVSGLH